MAIELRNLSYKYNSKLLINNININFDFNKVYGIIGSNEIEKTTLLELIDGLIKPSIGNVIINKEEVYKNRKLKKRIGYVFKFSEEQIFESTVKKEIEFSLINFNMKKNKLEEVLELVGLSKDYINKKTVELSSGEKRLLSIASVLVYNPDIILFDNPTIGLDKNKKNKILKLIRDLKNEYNKTIFIISNDIDFLYQLCDEFVVIDNGEIIINGEPNFIYNEKDIIKQYNIEVPNILNFEKLVRENKKIKLMHSTTINDLIKEVYRNV